MDLRRRKSRKARAADTLRNAAPGRRRSKPARMSRSLRGKLKGSGAATTLSGAGMAGRAAGRHGKAMAKYTGRKAAGKRAPLLATLPLFAGASIAGVFA